MTNETMPFGDELQAAILDMMTDVTVGADLADMKSVLGVMENYLEEEGDFRPTWIDKPFYTGMINAAKEGLDDGGMNRANVIAGMLGFFETGLRTGLHLAAMRDKQ